MFIVVRVIFCRRGLLSALPASRYFLAMTWVPVESVGIFRKPTTLPPSAHSLVSSSDVDETRADNAWGLGP